MQCGVFPLLTAKENVKYIFSDIELPSKEPILETTAVNSIEAAAEYKYNSLMNDVMHLGENKDAILAQNREDLERLITYCYEKNYTPVLICAPITKNLTDRFSDEFMREFDENNAWICEKYPDIPFFDYSRDERFATSLELFRDSDHLNSAGGDAFTSQLLEDLAANGILQENLLIH